MLRKILVVGMVLGSSLGFARLDGGKPCAEKEFPDAINVVVDFIDPKTKKVVWDTSCSGTVISEHLVLTSGHCLFDKSNLIEQDFLPKKLLASVTKNKTALAVAYFANGKAADYAFKFKQSYFGLLVFSEKLPWKKTAQKTLKALKGDKFSVVGFSPEKQYEKLKVARLKNIDEYDYEEVVVETARLKKALKYEKQCGTSEFTGWRLDRVKDFEGVSVCFGTKKNSCGFEHGDSGGGVYKKAGDQWQLVGVMEFGGFGKFKFDDQKEIVDIEEVKGEEESFNGTVFISEKENETITKVIELSNGLADQKTKKELLAHPALIEMPKTIEP